MALSTYARNYRAAAIQTATPGQLILMLFDGALRSMALARAGFALEDEVRSIEQIHNQLCKAQAILRELQASLDRTNGGAFAQRMWALYSFMFDQLGAANLRKDLDALGVVERLLNEIRGAWGQMLEQTVVAEVA